MSPERDLPAGSKLLSYMYPIDGTVVPQGTQRKKRALKYTSSLFHDREEKNRQELPWAVDKAADDGWLGKIELLQFNEVLPAMMCRV
jgi:hypothetical protein